MKASAIASLMFLILFTSCFNGSKSTKDKNDKQPNTSETKSDVIPASNIILVTTDYGNIKIKLYDETPLHRDNFKKLVHEGFYDSLLFHRVINKFMIQGGDPDSKNAASNTALGDGGPGYTIEAEFVEGLIHKKGALAAARQGDNINPQKRSSGSQFYIVQGQPYTTEQLNMMETKLSQQKKQQVFIDYVNRPENADFKSQLEALYKQRKTNEIAELEKNETKLQKEYEAIQPFKFSEKQLEIYTSVGGTPHLDGGYTVFGEVIEGLDVIDKIAAAQTNKSNRPVKDIMMKMKIVEE